MEMPIVDVSSSLPSVDGQVGQVGQADPGKADRIRALELAGGSPFRAHAVLAFITGENTQTLLEPLQKLLGACQATFVAQDLKDHVAVFDRVTDLRDAFGGVLTAMDRLRVPRGEVVSVPSGKGEADE